MITRRTWFKQGGVVLGGALLASPWSGIYSRRDLFVQDGVARLQYNENPYGPSPRAREAMEAAFDEGNLYSWAFETRTAIQELMAREAGVSMGQVMVGSGSNEVLMAAGLHMGLQGAEIVTAYPTYRAMTDYAEHVGARIKPVPLTSSLSYDLDALQDAITPQTRLVYVCNPNNPTGTLVDADDLESFCKTVSERVLVFVDEAYHEFAEGAAYRSMMPLVQEGHNLIVARTASKVHGLAGLRVGFGFGQAALVNAVAQRFTGSPNVVGIRGAMASYQDTAFVAQVRRDTEVEKQKLYRFLDDRGHRYVPSATNFVFFETGRPIASFRTAMQQHQVIVGRPFPPYDRWCRLSIGTPEAMAQFATAFDRVMG